ncbi:uncharacterized protein LOC142582120 [Dermacentor variabilis]|uniref:uncharacterized protein LOC142582120 n=1 Tax=Dermacentor variabilis TaxID=34621 RepID=UPI003F5B8915
MHGGERHLVVLQETQGPVRTRPQLQRSESRDKRGAHGVADEADITERAQAPREATRVAILYQARLHRVNARFLPQRCAPHLGLGGIRRCRTLLPITSSSEYRKAWPLICDERAAWEPVLLLGTTETASATNEAVCRVGSAHSNGDCAQELPHQVDTDSWTPLPSSSSSSLYIRNSPVWDSFSGHTGWQSNNIAMNPFLLFTQMLSLTTNKAASFM